MEGVSEGAALTSHEVDGVAIGPVAVGHALPRGRAVVLVAGLAAAVVRVVLVCNSDAFRVSETGNKTNRESITILQQRGNCEIVQFFTCSALPDSTGTSDVPPRYSPAGPVGSVRPASSLRVGYMSTSSASAPEAVPVILPVSHGALKMSGTRVPSSRQLILHHICQQKVA